MLIPEVLCHLSDMIIDDDDDDDVPLDKLREKVTNYATYKPAKKAYIQEGINNDK
jgi:hypothetical protein